MSLDVEYQLKPPDIMMTTVVEATTAPSLPMPYAPGPLAPPPNAQLSREHGSGSSSATELIIQSNILDDDNPFITTHPSVYEPLEESNRYNRWQSRIDANRPPENVTSTNEKSLS